MIDFTGFLAQLLNGVQYGLLLFLVASGLTLIFGVMGVINLAHGSLFMIGAYLSYVITWQTGQFWLTLPAAIIGGLLFGAALERLLLQRFYRREHLDQVLLTSSLILIFEEIRSIILGNDFHSVQIPEILDFSVPIFSGFSYSAYRLFVLVACLGIAALMFAIVETTRIGARIRAAAEQPDMLNLLGISAQRLHCLVFAVGTGLAMLAGTLAAPLQSVYPNMGDSFLIISFVVVVVGGIGSVAGAFWGALVVGIVDTFGKAWLPVGSGLPVYVLMAAALLWRPRGLFARG